MRSLRSSRCHARLGSGAFDRFRAPGVRLGAVIRRLSIHGLALIDELAIEFTRGFNVITGETGAGKSILIRALHFLAGAKFGPEILRSGFDAARVAGEFQVPANHPVWERLEALGLERPDEDSAPILLRRQLGVKGRSQGWINDVPVTNASLRDIGTALLDVFVQHENQRLLDPNRHSAYVDRFLADPEARPRFRTAYGALAEAVNALKEASQRLAPNGSGEDRDYVAFRLEQLEQFGPSAEDFESVEKACREAKGAARRRDGLARAGAALEGDGAAGASQAGRELRALSAVLATDDAETSDALAALASRAESVAAELEDLSYEIARLGSGSDLDEATLEEAESRRFRYQEFFRKYGVRDAQGLADERVRLSERLHQLDHREEALREALGAATARAVEARSLAEVLARVRHDAAGRIGDRVRAELEELAMAGAKLVVQWHPSTGTATPPACPDETLAEAWRRLEAATADLGAEGLERAEFWLAANPGEPALPLAKVASGGEMSRILLALKKAMAADAETCVLVFDEVDAGISGRVADVVGRKLKELADKLQVLCISHLPQVAAYARAHFLVSKQAANDRTATTIVRLDEDARTAELARLLSGSEVSAVSLANARALVARAAQPETKAVAKSGTAAKGPKGKRKGGRARTAEVSV